MDRSEVFYRIVPQNNSVEFEKVREGDFYDARGRGFIRKAILNFERDDYEQPRRTKDKRFVDPSFAIDKSKEYFLARISDLYDFKKDNLQLFPDQETSSVFDEPKYYCSFMCESGVLNYNYLRTLFMTQEVNQEGRYEYFVKRDGEYVLEECDDIIPVDKKTWKPLWGLNYKYPWQLLLLKAWIKECGGWREMIEAEPFKLLDAFGLPEYKALNFRKDIRFLKNERVPMEQKK